MGRAIVMGKATDGQEEDDRSCTCCPESYPSNCKSRSECIRSYKVHFDTLKNLGQLYESCCILYGPCHGTGLMEGEYPWIRIEL